MEVQRILPILDLPDDELTKRLKSHNIGLTPPEARQIAQKLGRNPSIVELFIFDIEWSEHCSYKSSRRILKKYLPTDGPFVILGPGEDAGIIHFIRSGEVDYAIVVGHESHNHPSQILPVEGAATGIGGIVRDVDCMGAHVCAVADSLRFGNPDGHQKARTRWIVSGVVDGIWQYGNAMGVPNLAGEVYFDDSFDDNCLVNVIALGVVPVNRIVRSRVPSDDPGTHYDLILAGKTTDASGFGGVTFASEILDHTQEKKHLGAVQVHDPFLKNILIMRKANKMVIDTALERRIPIGMKDLGGGGLACASSEICAAGGYGAEIDLDKVHVSLPDLPPEVIACGESQERFIFAVPESFTPDVLKIYNEIWNLPQEANGACARVIGRATRDGRYRIFHHGELVCDAPIEEITSGIQYQRESRPMKIDTKNPESKVPDDLTPVLKCILSSVNGCSRNPIVRHYDTEVQGSAVIRPLESDAGVIAPLELETGCPAAVALSVDGNPFIGEIDPYWAGAVAVAESLRNVIATGAVPRALTDCLNYGNPEKPEAFWQFEEGVRGIADAATRLWQMETPNMPVPIVSGNVSFYNESALGKAIKPSPIVACTGVMDDYSRAVTMQFKQPGSIILLIGKRRDELGGSAYFREWHHVAGKNSLTVDFDSERADMHAVTAILSERLALTCHDIADGGFATALSEMCFSKRAGSLAGARIRIQNPGMNCDRFLFSETGGFILEISPGNMTRVKELVQHYGAYGLDCGTVTQNYLIDIQIDDRQVIRSDVESLFTLWNDGLKEVLP